MQQIICAVSSRYCLWTCLCLQVPPRWGALMSAWNNRKTKEHHGRVAPDLHKPAYSLSTVQAPPHGSRPQTNRVGASVGVWIPWFQVFRLRVSFPQGSHRSPWPLGISIGVLHLYPKTVVNTILQFFSIFFPLCGCKSRSNPQLWCRSIFSWHKWWKF